MFKPAPGRPFVAALITLFIALLTGCASGLEVRSDIDPAADFSRFETWNFFDELGVEGGYNSPIYGELFRESISAEMERRGYRRQSNPDLYVNVTIRGDDKVEMRSYTAPYMSGAYYRQPGGPYYGSALGVGVGTVSRATRVTEASIFIDLVDNATDRLVWQGVAVAEANDETAQNLRNAIFTAVDRVFELYPHTASH